MSARAPRSGTRPPWAWLLVVRVMVWLLARVLRWRVQVRSDQVAVTRHQPLLVVFNHTSYVDAFLVAATVWRDLGHWVRPLVKSELFDVPVLGYLARQAGAIPVVRGDDTAREAAYGAAIEQLGAGQTILIAPESTTTHDGSLLPLRHGAARLALEAGADVLVVTHFGAQRGFSPIQRTPDRDVVVTMTMDLVHPWPDEDAAGLTGRIAATMMDRSEQLQGSYPQADPDAPWWPPYAAPIPPTEVARENLERYRHSMADAVAHARERMAQVAEDHAVEQRFAHARERAAELTEEVTSQARERATQARDRAARTREAAEALAAQAKDRADDLTTQARDRADLMATNLRDRVHLGDQANDDPQAADDVDAAETPAGDEPTDGEDRGTT